MNKDIVSPQGAWRPTQPSPKTTIPINSNKTNLQSEPGQRTTLVTYDNGQYHPSQQTSETDPNSSNSPKWEDSSNNQSKEGQLQANQQTTPVKAESALGSHALESPQAEQPQATQLGWQQVSWPNGPSSTAAVALAATSMLQESSTTSIPTTLSTATQLPAEPAPGRSSTGRSSATVQAAAIALSVILVLGFIGALVFLPLRRKRRNLQKALADQQDNPKTTIEKQEMGWSNLNSSCERPSPSMEDHLGPDTKPTRFPFSIFSQVVNQMRADPDHSAEPDQEVYAVPFSQTVPFSKTLTHTSVESISIIGSISDAGKEERSESVVAAGDKLLYSPLAQSVVSSDSTTTGDQLERREQSGVYGPASLENPSIGNLLAASPLVNNVYVVEMDFVPCREGQLELHTGQLLGISRTFDNGWVR